MLRWVVKEVESPYGNVATVHWAVSDDAGESDDLDETLLQQQLERAEDQLGAVLWNSNTVALRYLHNHVLSPNAEAYHVVELGAGVGCLGIALAMAGARVVITDIKELVPLMQKNIELNATRIRTRSNNQGSCEVLAWRWGPSQRTRKQKRSKRDAAMTQAKSSLQYALTSSESFVELKKKIDRVDIVVLCDALYGNPKDWPQLLFTLSEILLANPSCEVINFCEQRVDDVEGGFLRLLQQENSRTEQFYGDTVSSGEGKTKQELHNNETKEGKNEEDMWFALGHMRGSRRWCAVTEVVKEGASDLDMTVRVTRIRWVLPKRGTHGVDDCADGEEGEPPCKRKKVTI